MGSKDSEFKRKSEKEIELGFAKQLYSQGFSVMPVTNAKLPIPVKWNELKRVWNPEGGWFAKEAIEAFNSEEKKKGKKLGIIKRPSRIGLVCSFKDLEVIDVDTKILPESERELFWKEFLTLLTDNITNFMERFVIVRTMSGGYHILYRAKNREGNQTLAAQEFQGAKRKVKKALIETRGNGGYVVIYPTIISDTDYSNIPEISNEERDTIIGCAKWLDRMPKEESKPTKKEAKTNAEFESTGLSPWNDYNAKTPIWDLIQNEFTKVGGSGPDTNVLRNGSKASKSGWISKKEGQDEVLFLFTDNAGYPQRTKLNAAMVYAWQNHDGNRSAMINDLYNQNFGARRKVKNEIKKGEYDPKTDLDLSSSDYYNKYQIEDAKEAAELLARKLKIASPTFKDGLFYFPEGSSKNGGIKAKKGYMPITVMAKCFFRGKVAVAENNVKARRFGLPLIRVGNDFFLKVKKNELAGKKSDYLTHRKMGLLSLDYGAHVLEKVPSFVDFTVMPDHLNYQESVDGFFNLYNPIPHEPVAGDWPLTRKFLKHIFGEQYEQGIEYLQNLYVNPRQQLPVLCLVSEERGTGKTTFLNVLNNIFAGNTAMVSHEDLERESNGVYVSSLLVLVDELASNNTNLVEKIKNLATAKTLTRREKYQNTSVVPFFGKVVLNSNRADQFLKIELDEIRFWVIKVNPVAEGEWVSNIDEAMEKEIPAFLDHLKGLDLKAPRSRSVFAPEEIQTEQLEKVKKETHSEMYKEIAEALKHTFQRDEPHTEGTQSKERAYIHATPMDLRLRFWPSSTKFTVNWIRRCLKQEFKMLPEKQQRYNDFNGHEQNGRPYRFLAVDFED